MQASSPNDVSVTKFLEHTPKNNDVSVTKFLDNDTPTYNTSSTVTDRGNVNMTVIQFLEQSSPETISQFLENANVDRISNGEMNMTVISFLEKHDAFLQ